MWRRLHRSCCHNSLATVTAFTAFLGYEYLGDRSKEWTSADEGNGWRKQSGVSDDATVGRQVLARQLWHPRLPYPLWDYDWDGKVTDKTTLDAQLNLNKEPVIGTTRHIILIRHGQYDESSKVSFRRMYCCNVARKEFYRNELKIQMYRAIAREH